MNKTPVTFDVGESKLAAMKAVAGDALTDDLVNNMTDQGLDCFSAALYFKGLEFGEVSFEGPTEHEGRSWLIYPIGNPEFEAP